MDYQKTYELLIEKAKSRKTVDVYTEMHHIIPKSFGGSNEVENLVKLTAREHFIAHLLLAKIHGGKMVHAVYMMTTREGYTNRTYEKIRMEFIKGIVNNKERNRKISESLKGRPKTEAHKQAYKESRIKSGGWVVSEERKKKVSEKLTGNKNPMWGKTHNEESKRIISEANKQKINCPHCAKTGGIAIMKRWHFDNCKLLTQD